MYTYIFIYLCIFIYIIQEPPHLKLISFFFLPILVQEYWCGMEAAWNIMDAVIIVVSLVETGIDIWAQAGRWLGLSWGPFKSFQLSLESKVKVIYLYQKNPGITIKYTII